VKIIDRPPDTWLQPLAVRGSRARPSDWRDERRSGSVSHEEAVAPQCRPSVTEPDFAKRVADAQPWKRFHIAALG
jgi:hypothetical protein